MNNKIIQMMEKRMNGVSVEEILQQDLGIKKEETQELKKIQKELTEIVRETREKFQGMKIPDAIIQEIDSQYGDDLDKQFKTISHLKYHFIIRDFLTSKEAFTDPEFYEETLKQIYDKEQQMEDVTIEELEQLREELISIISDNSIDNLFESLPENNDNNEGLSIFEKAKREMEEIPEDIKNDIIIMVAALYRKEHPEISKEQAVGEAMFISEDKATILSNFVWSVLPKTMGVMCGGIVTFIFGGLLDFHPLITLGLSITGISGAVLAGLSVAGIGLIGYEGIKRAVPYAKKIWENYSPFVKKCANKVKLVIANAIGVVTNKVFRPVIAWTKNTAIPTISEKIYYPLRRRLEDMIDWIIEKKEQFIDFIKEASAPMSQMENDSNTSSVNKEDEQEKEVNEIKFASNKENANEPVMAN